MAHTFNHDIRSPTSRGLLDLWNRIVVQIDHLRTELLRLVQALLHGINRNDLIDHRQRTRNRTEPHRPTPNTHNRELLPVPIGQVLEEATRGEVAGGENIRHQHQHLLRDILRRGHARRIDQRDPHVLRLPAIDRVRRRRVAEQLALATPRGLAAHAEEAVAAGGVEGHDDFVTFVEFLDTVALLDDLADELVAADEVGWAFEVAAVEVQVAAAEGGAGDFQDGVGGVFELGYWAVFDDDLGASVSWVLGCCAERWRYVEVALEHHGSHLLRETHCCDLVG